MTSGTVDCLFPLLLKEWKNSWVQATNSPGELKCQVEQAWGDGYADGAELIARLTMAGITVDIMLASGTEIRFPVDVLEIIRKTGMINDEGKLIVSRGVVEIGPDDNDLVKIIVGKKFAYEFGSKRG